MELDTQSQRIKDILRDLKYENKYVNSILSKKEELQLIMHQALARKKKEIETILQRNSQLEDSLNDTTEENVFREKAKKVSEEYMELNQQIKELQKKEKDLLCEINEVLTEKENLQSTERKELEEIKTSVIKLKAMSQLYINFLRVRLIKNEEKLYAYVAISDKDFKRFEVSNNKDKVERINKNWEELEKCLQ